MPPATLTQASLPAAIADSLTDPFKASPAVKLAVTNAARGDIYILSTDGKLLAALRDEGAGNVTSDINGNVYVVETKRFNRVREYTSDLKRIIATFDDGEQSAIGVDTFNGGKVVAVTNLYGAKGGPGGVSIFVNGARVRTITNAALAEAFYCAFDASGNLYLDGLDINRNSILGEIPNAATGGTTYVPLTTSNAISAVGIQVTTSGAIAIQDVSGDFGSVYTYNPPTNGSFGSPIATTPIDSPTGEFSGQIFAFTRDMTHLYEVDANNNFVEEYVYPGGGNPVAQIKVPSAGGIAVIPAQYPKTGRN